MTGETIEHILRQAEALGTIEWIYFEGGEAFLYYEILGAGIRSAKESGFNVGIVTNAFWATTDTDAMEWLEPFAGLVDDLSISSDAYHGNDESPGHPEIARRIAQQLGIPVDFISVAEPEAADIEGSAGQLPPGESAVLFRGRAAEVLASHVDPFGNLHICQGISIGNLLKRPLTEIIADYDADDHPIVGPLLAGGPAEIVRRYGVSHEESYADHCHLCKCTARHDESRSANSASCG
jgi:MoaA/NifB/PqqE/SkfB family radical SAM enzyme